ATHCSARSGCLCPAQPAPAITFRGPVTSSRDRHAAWALDSPTTLLVFGQQLDHGASPARRHARKCLPPARIPVPSLARSTGHGCWEAPCLLACAAIQSARPSSQDSDGELVWMSSCFNAAVQSKQRGRGPRTTTWVLSSIQLTGGVQVHAPNYGHSASPAARSVPL
ncbi:hypothetical protein CH063_03057, partial [Colletotrichum higginsianum]